MVEDERASVRLTRVDGPTGERLMITELASGSAVYLDPIELEGLTRIRYQPFAPPGAEHAFQTSPSDDPPTPDHASPSSDRSGLTNLGVLRNEFAMVRLARAEGLGGQRLTIQDLASGSEVHLDPTELRSLTRVRHEDFAPLLDPSDLVASPEPDPDQV